MLVSLAENMYVLKVVNMCCKPLGHITVSELSCFILLVEAKQQSVYTGCKSANDFN